MFMIHTDDHGHPHVTVYKGNPESHEAFAKVRLDVIQVFESEGFSTKSLRSIIEQVVINQAEWLKEWNETRPG